MYNWDFLRSFVQIYRKKRDAKERDEFKKAALLEIDSTPQFLA